MDMTAEVPKGPASNPASPEGAERNPTSNLLKLKSAITSFDLASRVQDGMTREQMDEMLLRNQIQSKDFISSDNVIQVDGLRGFFDRDNEGYKAALSTDEFDQYDAGYAGIYSLQLSNPGVNIETEIREMTGDLQTNIVLNKLIANAKLPEDTEENKRLLKLLKYRELFLKSQGAYYLGIHGARLFTEDAISQEGFPDIPGSRAFPITPIHLLAALKNPHLRAEYDQVMRPLESSEFAGKAWRLELRNAIGSNLTEEAKSILVSNLTDLVSVIETTEDLEQFKESMQLFKLAYRTIPEIGRQASDILVRNLDRILERGQPYEMTGYIQDIYYYGNEQHVRELRPHLISMLTGTERTAAQAGRIINGIHDLVPEETDYFLNLVLESAMVNRNQMVRDWEQSHTEAPRLALFNNLESVIRLEAARPGIVRVLHDRFGISDFARYPDNILIQQYEERDDLNRPYGVVLYPRADNSGAFYQDKEVFDKLAEQLNGRYSLRIYEAGSRLEVAKRFALANRTYGGNHKISFAVLGGHGTADSIQFGATDLSQALEGLDQAQNLENVFENLKTLKDRLNRGKITSNDFPGSPNQISSRILTEFFEENPTIILVSCSTGKVAGIAQTMSNLGAELIAPDADTNVRSITTSFDENNKPHFEVEYTRDAEGKVYKAGNPLQ